MASTIVYGITIEDGLALADAVLPDQASAAGMHLVSDGTNASWAADSEPTLTIFPNDAEKTLVDTDNKLVVTNFGDTDGSIVNLPTAAAGLEFTVIVLAAQLLTVNAATDDVIRISDAVTQTAGNISSSVIGSTVHLVAVDATTWISIATNGTWTVSAA